MKLSELLLRLNQLKVIPRTGWFFCNISPAQVEDVAQHSFEVASISFLLSGELEREGIKPDLNRVLCMALLHDWAETLVGDFPYPGLKYLRPRSVKNETEFRALKDLLRGLRGEKKYLELWQEYRDKDTVESKLVHSADYLSMLLQALKYREQGNRTKELDELFQAVLKDVASYEKSLPLVKALVREIDRMYSKIP